MDLRAPGRICRSESTQFALSTSPKDELLLLRSKWHSKQVLGLRLTGWLLKINFKTRKGCNKTGRQAVNNLLCYQVFYRGCRQRSTCPSNGPVLSLKPWCEIDKSGRRGLETELVTGIGRLVKLYLSGWVGSPFLPPRCIPHWILYLPSSCCQCVYSLHLFVLIRRLSLVMSYWSCA